MHFSVEPGAPVGVGLRRGDHVDSVALSAVPHEKAFVKTAVWPGIDPEAVRLAVVPVSCVLASIGPSVRAEPVNSIIIPVSFVAGSVCPPLLTKSIFTAAHVVSSEERRVWPPFNSFPLLGVFEPLAFVNASI